MSNDEPIVRPNLMHLDKSGGRGMGHGGVGCGCGGHGEGGCGCGGHGHASRDYVVMEPRVIEPVAIEAVAQRVTKSEASA